MGAGLFHADGLTDGRTDRHMTKLIAAFRTFANAPKSILTEQNHHYDYSEIFYIYYVECVPYFLCVIVGGGRGGEHAISRRRPRALRRVNGTLIRNGACRKELRGRLFSPFLEEYGGDSPRRKAEKLPDRP